MNANLYTMAASGEWDKVCRLCSEERNEMLPIFGDEGQQRKVVQKLRACLPVLVYKTDPLPKQICQFCAARLDDAYAFRERCLNVYRSMQAMLRYKQTESAQVFLDAMRNLSDPCQVCQTDDPLRGYHHEFLIVANRRSICRVHSSFNRCYFKLQAMQFCKEKSRAPPPLVPLSAALPFDNSAMPIIQANQDHLQGTCMETLSELPCEVEIKETIIDPMLSAETAIYEPLNKKLKLSEMFDIDIQTKAEPAFEPDMEGTRAPKLEYQVKKEEKRTSILEQVLTGSLTINNHQSIQPRTKLSSQWWCTPCNHYYKTQNSLMKHMQLHCPRIYTCRKCSESFESVEILARHEANNHLKIKLNFTENLNDCDQCERQFISLKMLKQHRLRDHQAELTVIGSNTWCSLCNRFFPTVESYQSHIQLHQTTLIMSSQKLPSSESTVTKVAERPREINRDEQYYENVKSLTCPTCGKICTQQSALSNHMRTHEPKKFKCDICGRSFGLFIRLAGHKITEHNEQPMMSSPLSAVEQEEALNAEREAREAREAKTRNVKRSYSEMMEKNDVPIDDESLTKRISGVHKNVGCGICSQWFSDHTTMLTHLQTHSDNYSHKNYICHVCKKSFKEQSQLLKHEACHKRLTLDNASLYTSAVSNNSFMNKMQNTHTVNKTYHCAKCNKIFFKEGSLLAHQCTGGALRKKVATKSPQKTSPHIGNKTYKCSKCDATFASSQSRNAHMKMHAEYMRGSKMQTHEIKEKVDDEPMPKLHPEALLEHNMSPIEPKVEIDEQSTPPPLKRTLIKTANGHRCGVCQSPFVSRELAVAHLRSAHPVMPFQCPYCKKRFSTQYTFAHHIKAEHPDEPEK